MPALWVSYLVTGFPMFVDYAYLLFVYEFLITLPNTEGLFLIVIFQISANELLDLKNFSPGVDRDNYTITFPQHPCVILNALEVLGFRVVSSAPRSGTSFPNQQSIVWTMRKEFEKWTKDFEEMLLTVNVNNNNSSWRPFSKRHQ